MAHENRWFTVLKNGGSFHGYVSHNQMVVPVVNDCKWENPVGLDQAYENH
jgi:hypothetical protein